MHHRDFPEIRADGGSPKEAASHLANKLALAMDTALTDWRRQTLGQAIADVEAFVEQQAIDSRQGHRHAASRRSR